MADNFTILDAFGNELVVAGKERTVDEVAVQTQVVEVNVGGETESLWDGSVSLDPGLVAVHGAETFDEPMSQDPVAIGGRASAATPTPVSADDDCVWAWFDRYGRMKVEALWDNTQLSSVQGMLGAMLSLLGSLAPRPSGATPVSYQAAYIASQTEATVYTPTEGYYFVCTHITISASGAGPIKLFDESDTAANAWSPDLSLAANGLWDAHFSDHSPLIQSAADNVIRYTSGAGAAGSIWLHGWEVEG